MTRPFPDPTILLHPNIPKPLHGMNPRTLLGQEWWDEKRQASYAKNDYHCWCCGIHKHAARHKQWLEGHEFYNIDFSTGRVEFIEVVALCYSCHNYIHSGRMEMIKGTNVMSEEVYNQIRRHGDMIVRDNKLVRKHPDINCKWEDYHLVIDGKNYGQKFKSYADWSDYYMGITP